MTGRKEPKRCRICLATNRQWTTEDAYPQWLRNANLEAGAEVAQAAGYRPAPRARVKPVCVPCQERLNTIFEDPASALFQRMLRLSGRQSLHLSPRQQVLLAGWVIKTDLLLYFDRRPGEQENAISSRTREMVRHLLHRMLVTGVPPSGAVVHLTRLRPGRMALEAPPPPIRPTPPGLSSTNIIVSIVSESAFGGHPSAVLDFIRITRNDRRFLRIWPPDIADRRWPLSDGLTFSELGQQRQAWAHDAADITSAFSPPKTPKPPAPPEQN